MEKENSSTLSFTFKLIDLLKSISINLRNFVFYVAPSLHNQTLFVTVLVRSSKMSWLAGANRFLLYNSAISIFHAMIFTWINAFISVTSFVQRTIIVRSTFRTRIFRTALCFMIENITFIVLATIARHELTHFHTL